MEFEKYFKAYCYGQIKWEWNYGIYVIPYTGNDIEKIIEKEYFRRHNNKFIIIEKNPDRYKCKIKIFADLEYLEPLFVFRTYEEATSFYKESLKSLGIMSWNDYRVKEISTDLKEFIDSVGSYDRRSFKVKSTEKNHFVYFLKNQGEIVYVGQSTSFNYQRPLQHTDKEYDEFEILEIPKHLNLNAIEALLIFKHKPKYNKGKPIASNVLNKAIECLMDC